MIKPCTFLPLARAGHGRKPLRFARVGPIIALWLLGSLTARSSESSDAPKSIQQLEVFPVRVRLFGPEAAQHLIVLGVAADRSRRDLTAEVRLSASAPGRVSIAPDRTIRPLSDGTVNLIVQAGSATAHVPVEVTGVSRPRNVSFRNEVEPG